MTNEDRANEIADGLPIDWWRGTHWPDRSAFVETLTALLAEVRREEREACAAIAREQIDLGNGWASGEARLFATLELIKARTP